MLFKIPSLAIFGTLCVVHPVLAQLPLRFVSFNIRYDNTDLSIADVEKAWISLACTDDATQCRAPGAISSIINAATQASDAGRDTIIGLQEVLDSQLTNIMDALGSSWAYVGVGRDDGGSKGEYNPIIYRSDIFTLVHSETKWLSETPDTAGSKSWGSGSNRIVTTAVFDHKATGRRFLHANTHLDNASGSARANQVGVAADLVRAVDAAQGGPGLPTTLTGDFNAGSSDAAYTTLVGDKWVQDVHGLATDSQKVNDLATFTGFKNEYNSRIDYVWVGPQTGALSSYKVEQYDVIDNLKDGVMISDHRLVVVDMTLG